MAKPSETRPSEAGLRRLYLDQRLSAQAIADRCGVRKITVLRWLEAARIERRPGGGGLANRGVEPPSAEELHDLVHNQHLGYRAIARVYGVDFTAVPHWLTKHGIPKPTVWETRRPGTPEPSEEDLRGRINRGETLAMIARAYGVNRTLIRARCARYGIEYRTDGWQGRDTFACADGHQANSSYEQLVDNWLHDHGIDHKPEPAYPWDRRYHADFRVGGTYIEVWGVTGNPAYLARRAVKIKRCREVGLDLINLDAQLFAEGGRWRRPLQRLVE